MPIYPDILGSFSRADLYQALIAGARDYKEAMRIFEVAGLDLSVPLPALTEMLRDVHRNHPR